MLHSCETKSEGRCRDEAKDYTDRDTIVITYKGFIEDVSLGGLSMLGSGFLRFNRRRPSNLEMSP